MVVADHLDVVGQFDRSVAGEPYVSWLKSGSGLDEARFTDVWNTVGDRIAQIASVSAVA